MSVSSFGRQALAVLSDVAREGLVDLSRARPARRARPDGEPLRVLFTIDTEISMGGSARNPALLPVGARRRIWAETAEGAYGIGFFMDLFDGHDMKAVFFFEPVARHVVPEAELAEAAKAITERGHDVELHVHPEFAMDLARVQRGEAKGPPAQLFAYSLDDQRRTIRESLDRLERWTGRRPCAFRAGGYSAGDETLAALAAEGVEIDSSYNRWAIEGGLSTLRSREPLNDVAMLGPVLEVPVTNLSTRGPFRGLRPLELSALDVSEVIAALEQLYETGARVACAVTHSFRLVRTRDPQYRDVAPDLVNIHRLRALCRYLARHRDRFEVTTYRALPVARWRGALGGDSTGFFPSPPAWSSALRMFVQGVKDRGVL